MVVAGAVRFYRFLVLFHIRNRDGVILHLHSSSLLFTIKGLCWLPSRDAHQLLSYLDAINTSGQKHFSQMIL